MVQFKVECTLKGNEVKVSGGGLSGTYTGLQFHFHWGDVKNPGSEHTIDEHRYPMEMHIVTQKDHLTAPPEYPDGYAVLGFFINESEPWVNFTSYLANLTDKGSKVRLDHSISIDDLIGNVNLTKFYRYMGSLTTPACNEAVVWTIFHEPIHVNTELMKMFSNQTGYFNVYRPTQPRHTRTILTTAGSVRGKSGSVASTPRHLLWFLLLMEWFKVVAFVVCVLPTAHCASDAIVWCYHLPSCNDTTWSKVSPHYCSGSRQSPIDIVSASATPNNKLTEFTFVKYDDTSAMTSIENTGDTVKVTLNRGVRISGGDLSEQYDTLQFHLHWGNGSSVPGSEHTVDGKRYPMELHIVNSKSSYSGNTSLAVKDSTGLAALGFFIEVMPGNSTGQPQSWRNLTSYLANITQKGQKVSIAAGFSLDDLLVGVNRTKYYRYLGSLTTPACNEAVVWTVFKEPIKVSKDLVASKQRASVDASPYSNELTLVVTWNRVDIAKSELFNGDNGKDTKVALQ
ncbi:carbonic anhydrase-like [Neolamprologus brichardi]|uniref:carbonic anhydrase-like n=1 Tax=Neolamprologus brichardi TaxID=32507 RepID=UPI001643F944|nr:carbonic anhydrase-like [Neolamprologus brichardi]